MDLESELHVDEEVITNAPKRAAPTRTYGRKPPAAATEEQDQSTGVNHMDAGLMKLLDLSESHSDVEEGMASAKGPNDEFDAQMGREEASNPEIAASNVKSTQASSYLSDSDEDDAPVLGVGFRGHRRTLITDFQDEDMHDTHETPDTQEPPPPEVANVRGRIAAMRKKNTIHAEHELEAPSASSSDSRRDKLQDLARRAQERAKSDSQRRRGDDDQDGLDDNEMNNKAIRRPSTTDIISTLFADAGEEVNEFPAHHGTAQLDRESPNKGNATDGSLGQGLVGHVSDYLWDSDGNLLGEKESYAVKKTKKAKKNLSMKDALEMKKETERLLRSTVPDLPVRQSKLTIDKFLAQRGIFPKGRTLEVSERGSDDDESQVASPKKVADITNASLAPQERPADGNISNGHDAHDTFQPQAASLRNTQPSPPLSLPTTIDPKPTLPIVPLKVDKVISKSELGNITRQNAAIARRLALRAELVDSDDDDDVDMLEIVQIKNDEENGAHGNKGRFPFIPSQKPKRNMLNQQLMQKNELQAKKRRQEEEDVIRNAAEERERRKEERRGQRLLAKQADERNKQSAEDVVTTEREVAQHEGRKTGCTNENATENAARPPARRLFSVEPARAPFSELFAKEMDVMDVFQDSPQDVGEEIADGTDQEEEDLFADPEGFNLDVIGHDDDDVMEKDVRSSEDLDPASFAELHTGTQEFINITETQDNFLGDSQASGSASVNQLVLPSRGRATKMKGKPQSKGTKAGSLEYFFGKMGSKPASQEHTASIGQASRPKTVGNKEAIIEHGKQELDSTCPDGGGEVRGFGGFGGLAGASANGTDLLDVLSGAFDTTGTIGVKRGTPAENSDDDDPFAMLLRDSSDDEEATPERTPGQQRHARMLSSDDEMQQLVPRVRMLKPAVMDDEDEDDLGSPTRSPGQDDNDNASTGLDGDGALDRTGVEGERKRNHVLSSIFYPEPPKEKNVYIDEEAEEEEDEFFGLGGADGDDVGNADLDQDLKELVVSDEEHVEGFEDVLKLHREQVQQEHEKEITELLNDVTSGNLRRRKARRSKNGHGGYLEDSDEDDELLLAKIRGKHLVGKDQDQGEEALGLQALAANPETAPFAKCFNTTFALKELLSSDEDVVDDIQRPKEALKVNEKKRARRSLENSSDDELHDDNRDNVKRVKRSAFRTSFSNEDSDTGDQESGETHEQNDQLEVDRLGIDILTLLKRQESKRRAWVRARKKEDADVQTRLFNKRCFAEAEPSEIEMDEYGTSTNISGFGDVDIDSGRGGMGFTVGGEMYEEMESVDSIRFADDLPKKKVVETARRSSKLMRLLL